MRPSFAVVVVVLALGGCDNRNQAKVGPAIMPQAMGTSPAPAGVPRVVVMPGQAPTLPPGPAALAIDVDVPWAEIATLARGPDAPALLVGDHDVLRRFTLEDELDDGPSLRVTATGKGKFCLSPPRTQAAYCVEGSDRRHISAAFVREAMAKALAEYGLTQVRVVPGDGLLWADLVRTIDGLRTCCKVPIKVALVR
ncbi:MAG: hypothetical protein R3B06_23095 [Kofleriaceae bacterium]